VFELIMSQASGLRIVYFGTPEFAAHILRSLIESGENIVGVVTTPDKPKGRGLHEQSSAVSQVASEFNIPQVKPTKHRDPEFLKQLRALDADLYVVVAYKILPLEVISIPRLGAFNVHASLLPKYRGAAPLNWAIMNGETETGITTFLLEQGIDTGNILLQERTYIGPNETAGELHDRLMAIGARVAKQTIVGLADGTLQPKPQSNAEATPAPKIFPADCVIDFNKPALEVHNFIRGLSPYPGATTKIGDVRLKILSTQISSEPEDDTPIGTFRIEEAFKERSLLARVADGYIEILDLQREGKRAMKTDEFLRGNAGLFTE
jgi:methionyl-tRNA formyltransferase